MWHSVTGLGELVNAVTERLQSPKEHSCSPPFCFDAASRPLCLVSTDRTTLAVAALCVRPITTGMFVASTEC